MQLPFYSVGLHCVATIIFVNEAIVSGRELGETSVRGEGESSLVPYFVPFQRLGWWLLSVKWH